MGTVYADTIFEIQPLIYNTSNARIALYKVMTKLEIPFHYVPDAEFLTVTVAEEDAVWLSLLSCGEMVDDLIITSGGRL